MEGAWRAREDDVEEGARRARGGLVEVACAGCVEGASIREHITMCFHVIENTLRNRALIRFAQPIGTRGGRN